MKTILMISALVCAVVGRPQLLTNYVAHPYAVASAPVVTYEQNIIPDTDPAPVVPFTPIAIQPAVAPVDLASQYHSQDEFGQFTFGHASLGQAHQQTRDFTGAVRGSYTYLNPDGEQVVAHYVADAGGFRVSSNALPVAPTFDGVAPEAPVADLEAPVFDLEAPVFDLVAPVFDLEAPEQVENTEDVAAAIAEHLRLVEEQKALIAAIATSEAEAETEAPAEEPVPKENVVEEEVAVTEASEVAEAPVEEVAPEEEVVVEEVVEEAEPVVPAPLDAEGNVINTDEVLAAIAEHNRLIEEQNAALAAALAAATPEEE